MNLLFNPIVSKTEPITRKSGKRRTALTLIILTGVHVDPQRCILSYLTDVIIFVLFLIVPIFMTLSINLFLFLQFHYVILLTSSRHELGEVIGRSTWRHGSQPGEGILPAPRQQEVQVTWGLVHKWGEGGAGDWQTDWSSSVADATQGGSDRCYFYGVSAMSYWEEVGADPVHTVAMTFLSCLALCLF